ncbi:hypothetical protein NM27_2153 [Neisseria meningitidis NM27]|nr:hypothetical protein NM27_2153 [Neisseria meningitidis NM27]
MNLLIVVLHETPYFSKDFLFFPAQVLPFFNMLLHIFSL